MADIVLLPTVLDHDNISHHRKKRGEKILEPHALRAYNRSDSVKRRYLRQGFTLLLGAFFRGDLVLLARETPLLLCGL